MKTLLIDQKLSSSEYKIFDIKKISKSMNPNINLNKTRVMLQKIQKIHIKNTFQKYDWNKIYQLKSSPEFHTFVFQSKLSFHIVSYNHFLNKDFIFKINFYYTMQCIDNFIGICFCPFLTNGYIFYLLKNSKLQCYSILGLDHINEVLQLDESNMVSKIDKIVYKNIKQTLLIIKTQNIVVSIAIYPYKITKIPYIWPMQQNLFNRRNIYRDMVIRCK